MDNIVDIRQHGVDLVTVGKDHVEVKLRVGLLIEEVGTGCQTCHT